MGAVQFFFTAGLRWRMLAVALHWLLVTSTLFCQGDSFPGESSPCLHSTSPLLKMSASAAALPLQHVMFLGCLRCLIDRVQMGPACPEKGGKIISRTAPKSGFSTDASRRSLDDSCCEVCWYPAVAPSIALIRG